MRGRTLRRPSPASTDDFLERLGRIVRAPVITVALGHLAVRKVSFGLAGVPVQHLPVITKQSLKCVPRRESHTYAETPFGARRLRIYEIMFVAVLHY